jgi:hypothetical protein
MADDARQDTSDHDLRGRDSGRPGGGQGRREEASGNIWPMSGPLPPSGEARTVGQQELGRQGTRGAAGSDDAGESELTLPPTEAGLTGADASRTAHAGPLERRHQYPSIEPHERQAMEEAEGRRGSAEQRPSA